MNCKKLGNLIPVPFIIVFAAVSTVAQVSSHIHDIIPLSMSSDVNGASNTKLNVNGKNMYQWFDYPVTYGHVLSTVEENDLNSRTEEGKEREVMIAAISMANSSAFCASVGKLSGSMKNDFKDLKGKFLNELVYKVSECNLQKEKNSKSTRLKKN